MNYRYFLSMVQLKVATGVELMTLLFPHHFLLMGSLANAIKGEDDVLAFASPHTLALQVCTMHRVAM